MPGTLTALMLVTTTLLETADLTFGRVVCSMSEPTLSDEEMEPAFSVSFPISGVYVRHVGRDRVVASTATAVFFNSGEVHRVAHPAGAGDVNVCASLSESLVEPFLSPESERFPLLSVPAPVSAQWRIRLLVNEAIAGYAGPLEVEETVINLVRNFLGLDRPPPVAPERVSLTQDAQEYLAVNHTRNIGLRAVSSAVGSSPHHLSRVFRSVTGITLSEYRTRLRLGSAIDRISKGADDLSTVAVETGFYDNAHLSRTMQRHLGMAPSQIRKRLSKAA